MTYNVLGETLNPAQSNLTISALVADCRFECGGHNGDVFNSRPILSSVSAESCSVLSEGHHDNDAVCVRSVISWLERVLAAVDCYSWTFSQNLLTPALLFTGIMHHPLLTSALLFTGIMRHPTSHGDFAPVVVDCFVDEVAGHSR